MLEYTNPAGRLWTILKRISEKQNADLKHLAVCFGVPNTWDSVLQAIKDLEAEFQLLEGMVEGYKDNKKKHALHSSKMGDIKKSLNQLTLNIGANNYVWNILPSAIVALEFMAADMPEEQGVGLNELEEIRRLCEELRTEIHGCDSLNRTLKEWLLDLVRLMREGIDRYQIRGSRGLRRQFHEMIGSMVDNYDLLKEVKEKGPTVWQKVSKVVELVHKASELGQKATKALGFVTKLVKFFGGETPTPPMLGN
jgi:hypothetical protein